MSQTGFAKVAQDITQLCELQWQLLMVDSQEARKAALPASIYLVVGGAAAFIGTLFFAAAISFALHEVAGFSLWSSCVLTGLGSTLVAGITAWLGLRGVKKTTAYFGDSRSELGENIKWLRATILDPDSPRNQMALRRSRSVNGVASNGSSLV